MALRTNQTKVAKIIDWRDGSNGEMISLDPFIETANILTDWLSGEDSDSELSAATLTKIETLLAAHFYEVQRDPRPQSKSTDGASGSFQGQTGFALQSTHHGQTAMIVDSTGLLTKRNLESQQGKRVATTTWIGYQDHSEDPYD